MKTFVIVKVKQEHLKKENNLTENSVFDLADATSGLKFVKELTRKEKYCYLTKHYCPKDQNSLFKDQCIQGGEAKNITHQFSWIQNKPCHFYSKELQGGLYKGSALFDQNLGSKPRGKFVKTVFQDIGNSEKIAKHEPKECHKDALDKARNFFRIMQPTHVKNSDEKYKRNVHTIKIIIRAVLLCTEQRIIA